MVVTGYKTLKEGIKTQRKMVTHSNSTRAITLYMYTVGVGTTAITPYFSICPLDLVLFRKVLW